MEITGGQSACVITVPRLCVPITPSRARNRSWSNMSWSLPQSFPRRRVSCCAAHARSLSSSYTNLQYPV